MTLSGPFTTRHNLVERLAASHVHAIRRFRTTVVDPTCCLEGAILESLSGDTYACLDSRNGGSVVDPHASLNDVVFSLESCEGRDGPAYTLRNFRSIALVADSASATPAVAAEVYFAN